MAPYATTVAILLAFASCARGGGGEGQGTPRVPGPPCLSSPASRAELGSPHRGGRWSEFTTDGSDLYVTARHFEHGGMFDPPTGTTFMWFGPADQPPRANEQTGQVDGATRSISVREGTYGELRLPAGRYWVQASTGGDLLMIACTPGALTDPHRV